MQSSRKGGNIKMAGLLKRSRLARIAPVVALGLTVLPGLLTSLLVYELASWLPGTSVALADEHEGTGG
jgi:hypothetical protein